MQQAGYHHANMLATQLEVTINTQGTEVLEMLQAMQLDKDAPNGDPHQPPEHQPIPLQSPAANAAVQQDVQLEMLRILQSIQQSMNRGGNGGNGGGRGRRNGCGGRNGRGGRGETRTHQRTPDDAIFPRQGTTKYYFTHGGSNHISSDCTRQTPGRNNAATREN